MQDKVEQEVPGGSQAPICEEGNVEQGSPCAYSSYRTNMTCFTLFYCL
jgi:hypothetical protein